MPLFQHFAEGTTPEVSIFQIFPKKMHDVLHMKVMIVLLGWSMKYQQHTNTENMVCLNNVPISEI